MTRYYVKCIRKTDFNWGQYYNGTKTGYNIHWTYMLKAAMPLTRREIEKIFSHAIDNGVFNEAFKLIPIYEDIEVKPNKRSIEVLDAV
jgi:hypothetical protein